MNANSNTQFLPQVIEGGLQPAIGSAAIPSEIPDAPAKLTAKEKKIWEHVTGALFEYGLIHRTDGLALTVICKTFQRWVETEDQLTDFAKNSADGSYIITSPNGYQQPHQLYYMARNLKKELLQWLPEAALTIPSFHKIMGERLAPEQGTLFEDPVEAHKKRGNLVRMRDAAAKQ